MTLHMTFIDNEINKFSECTNMFCFGNSLKKSIKNMQYQKPHSVYFYYISIFYISASHVNNENDTLLLSHCNILALA